MKGRSVLCSLKELGDHRAKDAFLAVGRKFRRSEVSGNPE